MTTVCSLVDADGTPIRPASLPWRAAKAGPELVDATRRAARADGRVIEYGDDELLTLGVAARLVFPKGFGANGATRQAAELLAEIGGQAREDAVAVPIALGALAFDAQAPAELTIPRFTLISDAEGDRAIAIGDDADVERVGASADHCVPPDDFRVASARPAADYRRRVADAVTAIRDGALDKVVLARELVVEANRPFCQADLVTRLRARHHMCAVFAIDGFIGASPELLVSRHGSAVVANPLAGTIPRGGNEAEDRARANALMSSLKELAEHRFVVDDVTAVLSRFADEITVAPTPELVLLANVLHLGTPVHAELRRAQDGAATPSVLEIVDALHPTSAIGGSPRGAALDYRAANEGLDRRRYGGPVGWLDANGDGAFWIGIRSAEVDGKRAHLFAGAGIVADSDPDAELDETAAEIRSALRHVHRGVSELSGRC